MSKRITGWCMVLGLASFLASSGVLAQDVTADVTADPVEIVTPVVDPVVETPVVEPVVVDPSTNPVVDPTGWGGTPVTTQPPAGTGTPPGVVKLPPVKTPTVIVAQKHTIMTKVEIRALLADGKYLDAEKAYHTWATYWFEEDRILLAQIEQSVLMQQYRDGQFRSLLALTEAGDQRAKGLLQGVLLNDPVTQGNLTDAKATPDHITNLIDAVNMARVIGDKSLLNALMLVIKSDNRKLANTAIEVVGDLGDTRIVPDLLKAMDNADTEQTVYLARALDKLGASSEISIRFTPQLRFPNATTRTRASLALGSAGDMAGGINIYQMLMKKDPLAIQALGGLETDTSQAYVMESLNGNEAEQLAAMKSLNVISDGAQTKLQQQMLLLIRNTNTTERVRIAAIRWCAMQPTLNPAMNIPQTIWSVAVSDDKSQPDNVRAAAISASARLARLASQTRRNSLRVLATGSNATLAMAAREALLYYALHAGIKK